MKLFWTQEGQSDTLLSRSEDCVIYLMWAAKSRMDARGQEM